MKKNLILKADENMINKLNDNYLDKCLEKYYEAKANDNTPEDDDAFFEAMNNLYKVLTYRDVIIPMFFSFYDNKSNCLLRKGKLPEGVEIKGLDDQGNYCSVPLYVDLRIAGSNDNFDRYVVIASSYEKLEKIKEKVKTLNSLYLTNLKEIYERYVKNDPKIDGIVINPDINNLRISRELCEYICNDCPEDKWKEIVERTKDRVNKMMAEKYAKLNDYIDEYYKRK